MEAIMSIHTNPHQEIIPPDQPVAVNLKPVQSMELNSGMSAAGPLIAPIVGLAIFGLFVFAATRSNEGGQPQQAAAQQQQQNPPSAATTGTAAQNAKQADTSAATSAGPQQRETTGAAPVEQQRDKTPSEAKSGVPGR
jgi:hypothetical protein